MTYRIALPALLLSTTAAVAEAPNVVADILPVHSMVATVMQGVGEPSLLLPPGADPHSYSMRPSEAQMLSDAEIVFWVGEGLTPWLVQPIEAIAEKADVIELMEAEGFEPRAYAEGEGHDDHEDHDDHDDHDHGEEHAEHKDEHDHEEHAHDDHDHDEHAHDDHGDDEHAHDDHGEEEHASHSEEEHGHDDHAGHDHGEFDPHAWLDPEAAITWIAAIAEELSEHDPDNAAIYEANAEAAMERLHKLTDDLAEKLEPLHEVGFVTQHDGYRYWIDRFDLAFEGAISSNEAEDPSPADIARVQEEIAEGHVKCVFSEVQLSDRLIGTATEGSDVKTAALDTLGAKVEPGPGAYEALLVNLGDTFTECLSN